MRKKGIKAFEIYFFRISFILFLLLCSFYSQSVSAQAAENTEINIEEPASVSTTQGKSLPETESSVIYITPGTIIVGEFNTDSDHIVIIQKKKENKTEKLEYENKNKTEKEQKKRINIARKYHQKYNIIPIESGSIMADLSIRCPITTPPVITYKSILLSHQLCKISWFFPYQEKKIAYAIYYLITDTYSRFNAQRGPPFIQLTFA